MTTKLGLQTVEACPCGQCQKVVVAPLLRRVDASLDRSEAEEVVRRLNELEPMPAIVAAKTGRTSLAEERQTPDTLPMTFHAMARELLKHRTDLEIARLMEAECRAQGKVAFDAAQASTNKTEERALRQRAMDLGTRAAYWNKRSKRRG